MRRIYTLGVFICLLLCAFFLLSCGSAPQVAREELLSRSDTREVKGRIFVSPNAKNRVYLKVAVLPFRAPVELAGSSISDMFTTEILRSYKYQLVERSQIEQVLGEQALGLRGVTESSIAMRVGKILGVQGVIVGTVPEYGSKASGGSELSAIGLNVRMIDVSDGSVVWAITDTAISDRPISLSAFANRMVQNMVAQLTQEWLKAGDTLAVNIPAPQIVSAYGKIRGAVIEFLPESPKEISGYVIQRGRSEKGPFQEVGYLENRGSKTIRFEDQNLMDAETYYYQIKVKANSGFTGMTPEPIKITTAGPPGAVTGLSAQSGIIRKVPLTWQPSTDPNVKGYTILRKTAESPWAKVQTLENPKQSAFTDEGLGDTKAYSYRVIAINVVGSESPPSQIVTATTAGPPRAVTGLSAQSGIIRKVPLTWQPSTDPNVKGYTILRKTAEGPWAKVQTLENPKQSAFTDEGLGDNKVYSYLVIAFNVVGSEAPPSQLVTATTKGAPSPPQKVEAISRQARKIPLNWTPVPEPEVKGYAVYRALKAEGPFEKTVLVEGKEQSQYTDGGKKGYFSEETILQDDTRYFYKIRSVNIVDVESQDSPVVGAVTKPVPVAVAQLIANQFEVKQVSLQWQPNFEKDIIKYELFRGETPNSIDRLIISVPASTPQAIDKGLKDGTQYFYKVRAIDQDELKGLFSKPIGSTTKPLPQKPQGLKLVLEGGKVKLFWPPNPESDIAKYVISQKGFFFWDKIGETPDTGFIFTGEMKKGKTLTFRITAMDKTNLESEASDEVNIILP